MCALNNLFLKEKQWLIGSNDRGFLFDANWCCRTWNDHSRNNDLWRRNVGWCSATTSAAIWTKFRTQTRGNKSKNEHANCKKEMTYMTTVMTTMAEVIFFFSVLKIFSFHLIKFLFVFWIKLNLVRLSHWFFWWWYWCEVFCFFGINTFATCFTILCCKCFPLAFFFSN